MKTRILLIPRRFELTDEDARHLDGTGRGYEVPEACPQFKSLAEFMDSTWFSQSKHLGPFYSCYRCEFEERPHVILEWDYTTIGNESIRNTPTVICEEVQRFGEAKQYEWLGRLCPRCVVAKKIENRTAHIPQTRKDSA